MNTITTMLVDTARLKTGMRCAGSKDAAPVLFIHGNCSSSLFWQGVLAKLPPEFYGVAVDLRGYGDSEPKAVDATRGLGDFADDVYALWQTTFDAKPVQLVGHSVGGGVAMELAIRYPKMVKSVLLVAPMSPFGFSGTRGLHGALCHPDAAGSGGATANPEFVKRIQQKDSGSESDFSPRNVLRGFYLHEYLAPDEDALVQSILTTVVGDANYPGDNTGSEHWPNIAPGSSGMNNAISPKYFNASSFADMAQQPPVLWIRGDKDLIVSDNSLFDLGALGAHGAVPGWPGDDVFPAQPMVGQTRAVLEMYAARGGRYKEEVLPNCGHSPYIEKQADFFALALPFWLDNR